MSTPRGLPKGGDQFVEAFAKGLDVIRAFGPGKGELTLSQVAERTGQTPAGARRLLYTLVALGYATVEGRNFALTPAILDLGYSYLSSLSFREVAIRILEDFSKEHGELCSLSVLDKGDIIYVARAEIRGPSPRRLTIGERLPAHATSAGQVLLTQLSEQALDEYLAHEPFARFTEHTLVDAVSLRRAVESARANGFAVVDQQLELGICGLAVPVVNREGRIVAALSTSLNTAKYSPEAAAEKFLPSLKNLSTRVSRGIAD